MTDDDFDALLEELDGSRKEEKKAANFWAPETAGDTIMGVLRGVEYADTKHQRHVPVLTIERHPDGDLVSVWCFRTVLVDQLRKKQPALGTKLVIRFDGTRKNQAGTFSYSMYSVVAEASMELGDGIDWFKAAAKATEDGNLQMF